MRKRKRWSLLAECFLPGPHTQASMGLQGFPILTIKDRWQAHSQRRKLRLRDLVICALSLRGSAQPRSCALGNGPIDSGPRPRLRGLSEMVEQPPGVNAGWKERKGRGKGRKCTWLTLSHPKPDCHGFPSQQALSGITVSKWSISGPKDSAVDTHLWEADLNFHHFKCFTDLQNKPTQG